MYIVSLCVIDGVGFPCVLNTYSANTIDEAVEVGVKLAKIQLGNDPATPINSIELDLRNENRYCGTYYFGIDDPRIKDNYGHHEWSVNITQRSSYAGLM